MKVVLLEADLIGQGASGASTGWLPDDPGIGYLEIEAALGRRAGRHTWKSWHRAALDFAALLRRLNIKCQLQPQTSMLVAATAQQTVAFKREQKVRREAGLDASIVNARTVSAETAVSALGAIRSRDSFTIDPYRAASGLASEAARRGAQLFERSAVRRIKFTRKWVDVITAGGAIRAARVVIATGMPTPLFRSLARHFWFKTTYLVLTEPVPAKIRKSLGARMSVIRDLAEPSHVVRWVGEDRLLVAGADGDVPPDRQRQKTLVQRTGQLMYELSTIYPDISGIQPAYGWAANYARTADGLPFIGPHRNYPHHLFTFGDSTPGVTGTYLASRILLREFLGEANPADEAFSFNRYGHVR